MNQDKNCWIEISFDLIKDKVTDLQQLISYNYSLYVLEIINLPINNKDY